MGAAGATLMFAAVRARPKRVRMLRKVMWSGLYAGFGAISTLAARRMASAVWRVATGEDPPSKK